jgi:capsular exopolysaccharide synthesis family protein
MELRDYLRILGRRMQIVLLTTIVTLGTLIAGSLLLPPTYSATTTLRVAVLAVNSIQYADLQYSDRLLNTMAVLATTDSTLTELARQLDIPKPPQVSAEIVANTELLRLTVEAQDAPLAQAAANALAAILMESAKQLYAGAGETTERILSQQLTSTEQDLTQVRQRYSTLVSAEEMAAARRDIDLKEQAYAALLVDYQKAHTEAMLQSKALSVVEPAGLPSRPIKPRLALNLALGVILGLGAGIGLAFLLEHMDSRLYTSEAVEAVAQAHSLVNVPLARGRSRPTLYDTASPQGESFRCLRAMVFGHDYESETKVVHVTSAQPKEGRSTIVANLAVAVAQSGRKVVVVDGDLRSPSLHNIFHLVNAKGLSNALKPELSVDEIIQETKIPRLYAITSGPLPVDPPEMLDGKQFATVVVHLARIFDIVILDGPALLTSIDASMIAAVADGVLLTVSLGQTPREALQRACKRLLDANAKLIGVVVNRADAG